MKFIEVLTHLLPGAEAWDEESLAEARACLEAAGPVFSDLLDEDGADAAVPPTASDTAATVVEAVEPPAAPTTETASPVTPEAPVAVADPGEAPAA